MTTILLAILLAVFALPPAPAHSAGPLVVLDPGHGGRYSGATNCNHSFAGKSCMYESDLNLDIAKRAEQLLTQRGFRVRMTRTADALVNSPEQNVKTWNDPDGDGTYEYYADSGVGVREDLQARVNIANCGHQHEECSPGDPDQADAFVSIHNNACGCASGTETYNFPGSTNGRRLASLVHEEVVKRIQRNNRGVKEANFYVLRWTRMPAALLEGAFVDNAQEAELLKQAEFRQKIAEGVAQGVVRYFDVINVSVPANGRKTISLNAYGAAGDVAAVVSADKGIIAERSVYYTNPPTGGTNSVGASDLSTTWYFAEGYTGPGFGTFLLLQNPGGSTASASVRFLTGSGGGKTINVDVGAGKRRTIAVNAHVANADVSMVVNSNMPVMAERAMYSEGAAGEGHVSPGARSLAGSWYFAEGFTGPGFTTFLLLGNPSDATANVTIRYLKEAGLPDSPQVVQVAPGTRRTIAVNKVVPDAGFGIAVSSDRGIVAERSIYRRSPKGATNVVGSSATATTWYLAEGYTGGGYDTWLLIANPGEQSADVEVALTSPGGSPPPLSVTVGAGQRRSLSLDTLVSGSDVSAKVTSRNGVPVVAERAMYFADAHVTGAHASLGARATSGTWHFAEGYAGPGFTTFVLLQNPNGSAANVQVKMLHN